MFVFNNAGHFMYREHPKEFDDILVTWINYWKKNIPEPPAGDFSSRRRTTVEALTDCFSPLVVDNRICQRAYALHGNFDDVARHQRTEHPQACP